jgi:lipid-binding SYLF domain-containing protein
MALVLNCFQFSTPAAAADQKSESAVARRLGDSRNIIDQMMASRDTAIPVEVRKAARWIVVAHSVIRVALGVGGSHGSGIVSCRTKDGWSAPAPVTLTGGSVGLQIGGQSNSIILVVLDQNAFSRLLLRKLRIGKDVAGSPGPAQGAGHNDTWRESPILSYSQSHGIFAGIDLRGTTIRQDKKATASLFERYIPILSILSGEVPPTRESRVFLAALGKYAEPARTSR